ncbi:hypothetical protein B0T17DRAFT_510563 [Bombardia bombarda]|uniref:Uncharacterized protein n=1 Tax=Bombardia bombarda TaxID=252184 RepID=A0AA40BW74_9PEZI|nr:hypothetical protein B0T17DRAFT_510563 [Bombardia bombarda]
MVGIVDETWTRERQLCSRADKSWIMLKRNRAHQQPSFAFSKRKTSNIDGGGGGGVNERDVSGEMSGLVENKGWRLVCLTLYLQQRSGAAGNSYHGLRRPPTHVPKPGYNRPAFGHRCFALPLTRFHHYTASWERKRKKEERKARSLTPRRRAPYFYCVDVGAGSFAMEPGCTSVAGALCRVAQWTAASLHMQCPRRPRGLTATRARRVEQFSWAPTWIKREGNAGKRKVQ